MWRASDEVTYATRLPLGREKLKIKQATALRRVLPARCQRCVVHTWRKRAQDFAVQIRNTAEIDREMCLLGKCKRFREVLRTKMKQMNQWKHNIFHDAHVAYKT